MTIMFHTIVILHLILKNEIINMQTNNIYKSILSTIGKQLKQKQAKE